ncbi:hypothetical protein [Streptomyces mirabilis]|uniref:hypothetical protein n=1 Tax=Streptomyces mirabilis TaxID=68239 RepID=UPI0033341A18
MDQPFMPEVAMAWLVGSDDGRGTAGAQGDGQCVRAVPTDVDAGPGRRVGAAHHGVVLPRVVP